MADDLNPPAVNADDEFAAAFADLNAPAAPAAEAPAPAVAPAAEAPAPVVEAPAPAAAPAGEAPAPAAAPTAEAPAPTPAPAPAYVPPSADEYQRLQAELAELKARPAPAAPTPAAEAPAPAPAPAPMYTADEQAALANYEKEWGEVSAGEALKRRAEYQGLLQHVFAEVTKYVQPLMDVVPRLETRTQYTELTELIPDYLAVRQPVLDWVEKQPAYLKAAFEQVTAQGTPEDIADLVERFRKETNWVAPATAAAAPTPTPTPTPAAAPAPKPGAALPTAAAAAAAALAPVKGSGTVPAKAEDPNDFDSAFKEFSAQP